MLAMCLEGIAYPATSVFQSYNQHFWRIYAQFQILATLIRNLFSQALWDTQNPCFWAVFEPLKITLTQLQAAVENFLSVTWPYNRYPGSTLGYKLSNAPTLMSIGWLQRSLTFFVKKVFFGSLKKTPPLKEAFFLNPGTARKFICVRWGHCSATTCRECMIRCAFDSPTLVDDSTYPERYSMMSQTHSKVL